MIWDIASIVCTLGLAAAFAWVYRLNKRLLAFIRFLVHRSARLEMVVAAARDYRDHGTASTWRGVLAQLEHFEAGERCPPDSAKH